MLSAAVTMAAMAATKRMYSGRRLDSSSTSTAPTAGRTTSIDRIGKSTVFTWTHSSDARERAPASERPTAACVAGERTSEHSSCDDEPREEQHYAHSEDLGVVADVAGLALAELARGASDGTSRPHDRAVDDRAVEPRQRVECLAPRPAHERGDELVVLPSLLEQRRLDGSSHAPEVDRVGGDDSRQRGGDRHEPQ